MVRRAVSAAGLLLAISSGCSSNVTENGTALLVVVDADPDVRMRTAAVNVTVRRGRGGALGAVLSTAQFRPTGDAWPFTFVVQAQDPSAGVEVYAEIVGGGDPNPISVARALTSYTANRTLVVPLMFWGGCTPMRCGALANCQHPTMDGAGGPDDCASAVLPPNTLTTYTAGAAVGPCGQMQYRYGTTCRMLPMPQVDGGTSDVPRADVPPVDVPPVDVPTDTPMDASVDVPRDVAADSPADVGVSDVPPDRGVDVLVDVPVCPSTPVQCDGGGMFGGTLTDTNNCGACGYVCPVREHAAVDCMSCACVYRCTAGYGDCDGIASNGCETHVDTDPANCGTCTHRCAGLTDASAPVCLGGVCVP